MLRGQINTIRRMLQPRVLYSTSTLDNNNRPNLLAVQLMTEFDISCALDALKNPELSNTHFEEWKSRMYLLRRFHFSDGECFKMISNCPFLMKIPLEKFENSVKQWYQVDFSVDDLQHLFKCRPQLLKVEMDIIRKRVPHLRVYFRTSAALYHLLLTSPNVMFDDWVSVMEKMDYVVKDKKFNMGSVINSRILSRSLNFIKFRFELLEKCGIYKQDNAPVHKINKNDRTKFKNPSLSKILCENSREFAELAQISDEEYRMCKNVFFYDIQEEEEEDDEDDKNGYNFK